MACHDIHNILGCVASTAQITGVENGNKSLDAANIQAAPKTKTGNQTADKSLSGPSASSASSASSEPKTDKSSSPSSTGSHPDSSSSAPEQDAKEPQEANANSDNTSESPMTQKEASQKENKTFFNTIQVLYKREARLKPEREGPYKPLINDPIIDSMNQFLIKGSLINAREQYQEHLNLLYITSIINNIINPKNPDPQIEFQYLDNMHIVALSLYLLSKLPTVGFTGINGALTPVPTGDEQAKGANDPSIEAEPMAEPKDAKATTEAQTTQPETQPAAQPKDDEATMEAQTTQPETQPTAKPKDDKATMAAQKTQPETAQPKDDKAGGAETTAATLTADESGDALEVTPPKESSPGDGTMGSPTEETSSFNIFNIPNDSTYASSFEAFMKDPYELMYFFLLRNVEFVITGNIFAIDIQPPSLNDHIKTLFTNNEFVKTLLPKEKTDKAFIADLMSVLSNISKYIEHHITLIKEKNALEARVQSYRNRRTFFYKSVDQLTKGLKHQVFQTFTIHQGGVGDEEENEAKNDPRKYWETRIVPLATLAPAAYVFIETCCPYVTQYHIHNIDKAQLFKLMISYLLDKNQDSIIKKAIGKLKNIFTKAKDTALVNHMMQTYNNTETQKWRYPVLRDFKALFQGTSDSDACAYEYLRIHEIIGTSHIPSKMEFYSVGLRNIIEKEENRKVYFPHTRVLVGSMAGNILTYSYPFRLDMPTFIYEQLEKNIESLIGKYEIRVLKIDQPPEVLEKIDNPNKKPYKGTWAYIDPDKPDEPTDDAAEGQDGSKEEGPEGQDGSKKEEPKGPEGQDGSKEEGPKGQDKPTKKGSGGQGKANKRSPPIIEPEESNKKRRTDKKEPQQDGAKLNPIVINFIKNEVLDKLTNLAHTEKKHTYYYADLKKVLLNIVNVDDKDYTLKEKDLLEKTKTGEFTKISITRSAVMARLNEAHNMLGAFKGIDVNDKLDLYEVYFTNIERVLYTQEKRSPGNVKPEVASTEPPQEADKPEGDKPEGDKPEGDKPEGDKPEGDKPEGDKPEGDKPEGDKQEAEEPKTKEPEVVGTESPPKKGGSQKKYRFKGHFYNIHEHHSIKYIITKEYGIVPIYS